MITTENMENSVTHMKTMRRCTPLVAAKTLVIVCLGMATLGCGSRYETVSVVGVVKVAGETPPTNGILVFTPTAAVAGHPMRPGVAAFDKSGRFEARAFEHTNGLIPGEYRVSIECWEVPPSMGGPPAKSYINRRYTNPSSSGLELSVPAEHRGVLEVEYDVGNKT